MKKSLILPTLYFSLTLSQPTYAAEKPSLEQDLIPKKIAKSKNERVKTKVDQNHSAAIKKTASQEEPLIQSARPRYEHYSYP